MVHIRIVSFYKLDCISSLKDVWNFICFYLRKGK